MIHYRSTPPGYGFSGTLCLTTALAPMPESNENTSWPNRNKLYCACIFLTEPLFKQKRRKAGQACWTGRNTCLNLFQLQLQQGSGSRVHMNWMVNSIELGFQLMFGRSNGCWDEIYIFFVLTSNKNVFSSMRKHTVLLTSRIFYEAVILKLLWSVINHKFE